MKGFYGKKFLQTLTTFKINISVSATTNTYTKIPLDGHTALKFNQRGQTPCGPEGCMGRVAEDDSYGVRINKGCRHVFLDGDIGDAAN